MQPFLDKLANHLYSVHGAGFSRICLIFPSRRAGLFFKQYVSRIIDAPIWLPDIYALEDFVVHKSGIKLSDPLELIARLYKVYRTIEKDKAQPFSDFISWGNMLLGDFDEIDQYLADGEKVFRYLDEIKAMKHWNPDGKPLTPFELDYLRFYNSLAPCYTLFRKQLLSKGEGYFGLAFEVLLEDIDHKSFSEWDKIVIAGFNALTAAEEKLFKHLVEAGMAEIYWDADDYYITDTRQEAGRFLREYRNKNTFGPLNWIGSSMKSEAKSISVIGVPGNVGQTKLSGELLNKLIRERGTSDGIALVLVDEGLLLPVLNSIPAETGDFNVTMGFPLKQTPVFSLINVVLTMFVNARRFAQPANDINSGADPVIRFYQKDIQRFFTHPFIVSARKGNGANKENAESSFVYKSFYTSNELLLLLKRDNEPLAKVFSSYLALAEIEPFHVISLIKDVISFIRDSYSPVEGDPGITKGIQHPVEMEYLFYAAVLCSKLEVILKDPELRPGIETVQALVSNLIAGMRLPFYGEPLNGLQVMGMLETRLLDFSDIIMISVNEGLLPKGKHQTTFIPDEVRSHFGMQRYSERTAVFAYHFYRLMQRVGNAWLIYNTEGDELGGGERSRFISQMLHEMPVVNPETKISEQIFTVVPGNTRGSEIVIEKIPEVMTRLGAIAERGLSPTALAMYMKCTLQFYFSQVLRISEPDRVMESVDASMLGEIVHEALYKTYSAVKSKVITPVILSEMLPAALSNTREAFASRFNTSELSTGKNLLIVKVAENMVKRYLLAEIKYLEQNSEKIEILILEEELSSFIEIADPGSGEIIKVKIHGKADRIDRVGGVTRIIDYKTGKVESKDLKIDKISSIHEKDEPGKLLQVLTYALMFSDMQHEPPKQLISGIISLRKSSSYLIKTDIDKVVTIDQALLSDFRDELVKIIIRIFDVAEPFSQTMNRDTCTLCAFNAICNRTVN